ncbi:MAG: hypothetical protein C0504_16640 [Candidatus Solibacter sp.]|nr:hypothetical protein [Candidatus Solibacter sp.]
MHLPLDQRLKQPLDMAHAELPEQIADGVVAREPLMPSSACKARPPPNQLTCANRLAPTGTAIRNAVNAAAGSMLFGDRHWTVLCSRTLPVKSILRR